MRLSIAVIPVGTGNVTGSFVNPVDYQTGADTYVEIGYTCGLEV